MILSHTRYDIMVAKQVRNTCAVIIVLIETCIYVVCLGQKTLMWSQKICCGDLDVQDVLWTLDTFEINVIIV